MSVLSKVLGFFGKKDASKADAKPAGTSARKAPAKSGSGKPETKVVGKPTGKTPAKATSGRTEAVAPVSKADAAKEAQRARSKAARKARKRNQA
jgi:hypothetical protein